MMIPVPKVLFAVFLLAMSVQAPGAEPADKPLKVLMVGNSLTYTYNIN